MPANQNEPINIAGKVVFSNPGIPSPAPGRNEPIVKTGASGSAADHATDALRTIAGQIPGTSVSFKNPA
jgi:hypothetical protein